MTHEPTLHLSRGDWPLIARKRGLTYHQLAVLTGLSPATVAAYACGARRASENFLRIVWAHLGYPELAQ